jgi:cytochrome c-type biogenesis protein CcmH/NrfG
MTAPHETGGSMAPLGLDRDEDGGDEDGASATERANERRARFRRYARWTVSACVLICVAGVARRFVVDRAALADDAPRASSAFTVAAQPSPALPVAAAPSELPAPSAPAEPARDPKEAKREKKAAQRALERGKLDAAIASGTRSVALDPTDAEAWLVLGAAYMEKHDTASARKAFTSCTTTATHGSKKECASMLR